MNEHMQIKEFSEYMTSNKDEVNKFLKSIGTRVVSVTPLYNTISDGIQYIVVYWGKKNNEIKQRNNRQKTNDAMLYCKMRPQAPYLECA